MTSARGLRPISYTMYHRKEARYRTVQSSGKQPFCQGCYRATENNTIFLREKKTACKSARRFGEGYDLGEGPGGIAAEQRGCSRRLLYRGMRPLLLTTDSLVTRGLCAIFSLTLTSRLARLGSLGRAAPLRRLPRAGNLMIRYANRRCSSLHTRRICYIGTINNGCATFVLSDTFSLLATQDKVVSFPR